MNLHSIKMTWEENTWGRNYRVRKFRYKSSFFENTREECGVYPFDYLVRNIRKCSRIMKQSGSKASLFWNSLEKLVQIGGCQLNPIKVKRH